MLAPLLLVLAAAPPTLALPGLNAVNLDKGADALYAELLAQELTTRGLRIMTARDISATLGLERQRQLLGCSEEHTCISELVGALGADGLIVGDVGKLGAEYVINLKVLSAVNGSALAIFNTRAAKEELVPKALARGAWSLTKQLADKQPLWVLKPGPEVLMEEPKQGLSRWWAVVPAAVGVGGVAAGVALQLGAEAKFNELKVAAPSNAQAIAESGRSTEVAANVLLGVGAAGLVGAAVILIVGTSPSVQPTVSITSTSTSIGLVGVLP